MYCSKCGQQIADGSHFCPECGAQLDAHTQPPPQQQSSAAGTRDQTRVGDMVYPKNPPVSPHIAWLCLIWPGLPLLIHGQTAKGVVLMAATMVSFIFPILTLVLIIITIIDAFKVGKVLASGKPVAKWAWFPS